MGKVMTALAAAMLSGMSASVSAAYYITVGTVSAVGTTTTASYDYGCMASCPTNVSPYDTLVNGMYAGINISSLDGAYSFVGQDRSRGSYTVNFAFADGRLLFTNLDGFQDISRCLSLPCTAIFSEFSATNFALQVRDEASGHVSQMAPVPEPGTWAMLLIGFLIIGCALRQRQPAPAILVSH